MNEKHLRGQSLRKKRLGSFVINGALRRDSNQGRTLDSWKAPRGLNGIGNERLRDGLNETSFNRQKKPSKQVSSTFFQRNAQLTSSIAYLA